MCVLRWVGGQTGGGGEIGQSNMCVCVCAEVGGGSNGGGRDWAE